MKITNKHGLPQTIVDAITKKDYDKGKADYSISELISPPQMRMLKLRHYEDLEMDISEGLWMLLGSAAHSVLERGGTENVIKEERLFTEVSGKIVSGQIDFYEMGTVCDYKVTSAASFFMGVKPEWVAQLNCYAQLYREHGFPVERLAIHAILRDWTKRRAMVEADYPPIPFIEQELGLWDEDVVKEYMRERVALHESQVGQPDRALFPCTASEMWEKPTTYAIMKKGNKRATRVLPTMEEAEAWMDENGGPQFAIEVRPGERTRCEYYCPVSEICHQNKAYQATKGV